MSFSFRRSNAKEAKVDAIDDQNERWEFGFSGINFDDDELEYEQAPSWPARDGGEDLSHHSVEQLEFSVDFSDSRSKEESPRPVAIELTELIDLNFKEQEPQIKLVKEPSNESGFVQRDLEVVKLTKVAHEVEPTAPLPVAAPAPIYKASNGKVLPSDPGLTFEQNLRRRFGGHVRSALGPGTVVEGKFRFDEPVRIDGTLSGEVKSSSALIVGEEAVVEGRINVGTLIVMGEVTGPIIAEDLVELKKGAQVKGDITTSRIAIEEGAIYDGEIVTRS